MYSRCGAGILRYLDVVRPEHHPPAHSKTHVENSGTGQEPQHIGNGFLQRHDKNLQERHSITRDLYSGGDTLSA